MRYNCGAALAKEMPARFIPISSQAYRIPALHMPSVTPMNPVFPIQTVHQIYAYLAAFLYADHAEPPKPHRKDEADPGS